MTINHHESPADCENALKSILHELDGRGKNAYMTLDELHETSEKLWKLNQSVDAFFADPNAKHADVERLSHELVHLFDKFASFVDPAWRLDEALVVPYERLVTALNGLQKLKRRGVYANAQVAALQDELNAVENEFVRDGKFVAPNADPNEEPKMGQAVLSTMLSHGHRLSRLLLLANEPMNAFLKPIHDRLEKVNDELEQLKAQSKAQGVPADLLKRVAPIQATLRGVENMQVDGKFVPPGWNPAEQPNAILEGQAEIHALLEQCYESVHDLLTMTETTFPETHHPERLHQATSSFEPTEEKIGSLQANLKEASQYLRQSVKTLSTDARHYLGKLTTKAYDLLKRAKKSATEGHGGMLQPDIIEPKLESTEQELNAILSSLKKLRTEMVFVKKAEKETSVETTMDTFMIEPELKRKLEDRLHALQSRLHAVDERRQDGRFVGDDGSFAPKGQAALAMLMEEAYDIVYELQE